jgi:hypothetical protein
VLSADKHKAFKKILRWPWLKTFESRFEANTECLDGCKGMCAEQLLGTPQWLGQWLDLPWLVLSQ